MQIGVNVNCSKQLSETFIGFMQWRTLGGGGRRGAQAPPIIFNEALVLKSGSSRKFSFQEVEII